MLDVGAAQKRLDVGRLQSTIQNYLPSLAKENQIEVVHIVRGHLLYFLVGFENSANRPKVATVRNNINALESALRQVRAAMDSLDATSRSRLVADSVRGIAERGANPKSSLNWADLDEVTLQALEWTKSALNGLPPQGSRPSPPGLDHLVERLAKLFDDYKSPARRETKLRSTKQGNLGDFISCLIGCLDVMEPLTRYQIDNSLRKFETPNPASHVW